MQELNDSKLGDMNVKACLSVRQNPPPATGFPPITNEVSPLSVYVSSYNFLEYNVYLQAVYSALCVVFYSSLRSVATSFCTISRRASFHAFFAPPVMSAQVLRNIGDFHALLGLLILIHPPMQISQGTI